VLFIKNNNRSVDRLDDIDHHAHRSHNDNDNSTNAQTHDTANNAENNETSSSREHPDVNSWKHAATSGILQSVMQIQILSSVG
jgi:hypothetical protein